MYLFTVCFEMRQERFEIFLLNHFDLVRALPNVAVSRCAGIADDLSEAGCVRFRDLTRRDETREVIGEVFHVLVDELDRGREVLYRARRSIGQRRERHALWHRKAGTNRLLPLCERVQLLRHPPDKVPVHRLKLLRLLADRMRASSDRLTSVSDKGQVGALDFGLAFCRRQGDTVSQIRSQLDYRGRGG